MARAIDQIIARLNADVPDVHIAQLHVSHPGADDDGLWFIGISGRAETVQVESSDGNCPLLIESDFSADRLHGHTVDEVVVQVKQLYSL